MGRPKKDQATGAAAGTRAVIYLRVSTEVQIKSGYGMEMQQDACIDYCTRRGYTVVATFTDEAISGVKDAETRQGLAQALLMCVTKEADVFVSYALDRQSRDVGLFNSVREQLRKAKARFETVKEAQDFTTDENMLMGDIYAAFAAEERRRITARLYGGRRVRSKRDGLGSGPLPYGYKRMVETREGETVVSVVADEPAIPVIRLILSEREKGTTYHAVIALLQRKRIPTPRGNKEWKISTIQAIEKHASLYRTGSRVWDGVEASVKWPALLANSTALPLF